MTSIEWVKNPDGTQGITWNPITGCLNHANGLCKGGGFPCYAYKLANGRLKHIYLHNSHIATDDTETGGHYAIMICHAFDDPFYPRFWEERLYHPWNGKPRGIFPCDMGDLFGIGIPDEWTRTVLDLCRRHEQNRYYLLTKQPQRLPEFSPFPENCWVGVTATNSDMAFMAVGYLRLIEAKVKYISFEPLLTPVIRWVGDANYLFKYLNWLIIGACTGTWYEIFKLTMRYPDLTLMPYTKRLYIAQPPISWLREIVEAADKAGVKVFLKDNLKPLLRGHPDFWEDIPQGDHPNYESIAVLRQELPK